MKTIFILGSIIIGYIGFRAGFARRPGYIPIKEKRVFDQTDM